MRRQIIEKVIANRRYRLEQFRNLPIGSEFFDWAALVLHKTEVRRVKLGPNSAEDIAGEYRNRMLGKSEVFLLCECAKAQSFIPL